MPNYKDVDLSKHEANIILYVGNVPAYARQVIKQYNSNWQIFLIKNIYKKSQDDVALEVDKILYVDFNKTHKLAEVLLPYMGRIKVVTAASDLGINYFKKVIAHVPYLRTATKESLVWSTNKYEMRKRFALFIPEHTPKFSVVRNQSLEERKKIFSKIGFPLIIKPADLASSLLVSICYHEEELEQVLRKTYTKIKKQYKDNQRTQEPIILAEEFMDGDMYSVDAYVDSRGHVTCCPLVRVLRGTDIGDDDFYNYAHLTPSGLRSSSENNAYEVTKKAIHALALRSTSTHVELLKIDDEWKVIEVGARMGGFRHVIYDLAFGINHALNDILVRIPKRPVVTKQKQDHAVALKWFAKEEGVIQEMKGIKKVEQLKSFHSMSVNKKVGNRVRFSKNGGKSVFHIFLKNQVRSQLLADIRRVEKLVEIKVK